MSELTKNITWEDVKDDPNARKVLDHGFVVLKSVYGEDKTVCEAARISYGVGTKSVSDDNNLIRYLLRHKHTSPFEQIAATFILRLPLFVMGQLVRHRTAKLNQYSGRYSEMMDDFFLPEEWRGQSNTNKQGSDGIINYTPEQYSTYWNGFEFVDTQMRGLSAEEVAFHEYQHRLKSGVSRELARSCLPQSTYTLCVWQCDIHNLMHFLRLRLDPHAQEEIRVFAQAMYDLVRPKFPMVFDAFEDYTLNAVTFSSMEISMIRQLLKDTYGDIDNLSATLEGYMDTKMSKREIAEFKHKLRFEN